MLLRCAFGFRATGVVLLVLVALVIRTQVALSEPTAPLLATSRKNSIFKSHVNQYESWQHPSILVHQILHPRQGLGGRDVASFLSAWRHAGTPILPWPLKAYYFAQLYLGLSWVHPASSPLAFRNCMHLSIKERGILAQVLASRNSVSSSSSPPLLFNEDENLVGIAPPSACTSLVLELVEGEAWPLDFPPQTFDPIPVGLRVTLAYHCAQHRDPNFRAAMGQAYISSSLDQAFYFEQVKYAAYHALRQGRFEMPATKPEAVASLLHLLNLNESHSSLTASTLISPAELKVVLAATENEALIMGNGIERHAAEDEVLSHLRDVLDVYPNFASVFQLLMTEYWTALEDVCVGTMNQATFRQKFVRLVDLGLNVNAFGTKVNVFRLGNPMLLVIRSGNAKVVETLLEFGLNINQSLEGVDLLYTAVLAQHVDIVHAFLANGANPRLRYSWNSTLLHFAVQNSDSSPSLIQLLIEYGADPLLKDNSNWLPVHRASMHGNLPILDYFIHEYKGPDGNFTKARTISGQNIFLFACGCRDADAILPYFLGGYAGPIDLHDVDDKGNTCLSLALRNRRSPMIKEIRRARLGLNLHGTFFYRACVASGNFVLLDILLKRGANINEKEDEHGPRTCLYHALEEANLSLVQFLIARGADLNPTSNLSFPRRWVSWLTWPTTFHFGLHDPPLVLAAQAGYQFAQALVEEGKRRGGVVYSRQVVQAAMHAATSFFNWDVAVYLRQELDI